MTKKAKKRAHKMPPLSFADKLIYWFIFLLLVALYFLLVIAYMHLAEKTALRDSAVVAYGQHLSLLWFLVPWMTFFLVTFILWLLPYQDRKPIFGLKNFKYGAPGWPKVYPVFMKNKPPIWVSERARKAKKQKYIALVILLLISFIPFPWSLYGRDCLHYDGSVKQYNMFNICTREYIPRDISSVKIEAYQHKIGRSRTLRYDVQMVFQTEKGKEYTFRNYDFRDAGRETVYWIDQMLNVKRRYDSSVIAYEGAEILEYVITDWELTPEEAEKLYQLFNLR